MEDTSAEGACLGVDCPRDKGKDRDLINTTQSDFQAQSSLATDSDVRLGSLPALGTVSGSTEPKWYRKQDQGPFLRSLGVKWS